MHDAGDFLKRRTVLGATLAVAGGMVLGAGTGRTRSSAGELEHLDVSLPEVRAGRHWLRLGIDNSPAVASRGEAVPLTLGTP